MILTMLMERFDNSKFISTQSIFWINNSLVNFLTISAISRKNALMFRTLKQAWNKTWNGLKTDTMKSNFSEIVKLFQEKKLASSSRSLNLFQQVLSLRLSFYSNLIKEPHSTSITSSTAKNTSLLLSNLLTTWLLEVTLNILSKGWTRKASKGMD